MLEWALVLPLAMPAYVLTFVALGQYGNDLPGLRSAAGAITVLTLVLYPYVYLLARTAFVGQSRGLLEAARSARAHAAGGDRPGRTAARAARASPPGSRSR